MLNYSGKVIKIGHIHLRAMNGIHGPIHCTLWYINQDIFDQRYLFMFGGALMRRKGTYSDCIDEVQILDIVGETVNISKCKCPRDSDT